MSTRVYFLSQKVIDKIIGDEIKIVIKEIIKSDCKNCKFELKSKSQNLNPVCLSINKVIKTRKLIASQTKKTPEYFLNEILATRKVA